MCLREFRRKIPGNTVPITRGNLLRKSVPLGHKKLARKGCVIAAEKSRRNSGYVRTHRTEITESPCTRN